MGPKSQGHVADPLPLETDFDHETTGFLGGLMLSIMHDQQLSTTATMNHHSLSLIFINHYQPSLAIFHQLSFTNHGLALTAEVQALRLRSGHHTDHLERHDLWTHRYGLRQSHLLPSDRHWAE